MAQFEDRCSDVGLWPSNFEDHLGNTTLSNGMMLEMKKSPLGTQVENKICKIHGCNAVSIRLQIMKVRDKYSKLRKSASKPGGRETLEEYLDEPFHLPVQELRQTPTKPVCPNCEKLNQVLEDMGNKHQDKINTVTNVMARRNKNLKNRGKKVRSKLKRLEKVIGTARNPIDTYLVGMRQQASGLATDYVESINSSIETIEPEVLGRVENTMTDRCSTNSLVDQNLGDQLNKKLNSFRCSMHPLDSFAKKADAVLKSNEGDDWNRSGSQPYHRRGESSCQALLRAADKLFNNPASGDPNALRSYLADKGLPYSLPRWVGNRLNILFQNASILLQIGDTIVDFFSKVQKPQNDLQRAFVNAWSVHQKCNLRSLTLLHKTLTAPWMEEVSKETPILQMNEKFQLAHSTLQMWQQQPQSSLSGETAFGGQIKKDATWELLHGSCDADKTAMLELYVQLIKGILDVIDRQLASQPFCNHLKYL